MLTWRSLASKMGQGGKLANMQAHATQDELLALIIQSRISPVIYLPP